jgi:DNA-binding transcriptional ArsR family regulator
MMKMNVTETVMDFDAMRANALRASNLLKVLANPDRLLLLCQLSQGEQCVSDLEKLVGIRQPTLSQQLTVLRTEKLVDTRREGKLIYYSIVSNQALAIMKLLYTQFCQPIAGEKND